MSAVRTAIIRAMRLTDLTPDAVVLRQAAAGDPTRCGRSSIGMGRWCCACAGTFSATPTLPKMHFRRCF